MSTTPPQPPRKRRWPYVLVTAAALAAGTLTAGWWWAGSPGSLAQLLAHAPRWLPAGHTLESRDVQGSLRQGGRVGWLRWASPSLAVEVQGAQVEWQLAPLLQGLLHVPQLAAERIEITPLGPPSSAPGQPLTALTLPLRVDATLDVSQILWAGSPRVAIEHLQGNYRYDGQAHQLQLRDVQLAQGRYTLDATVQAQAPITTQATLQGTLPVSVPGGRQTPALQAHVGATVQGTLAGPDAQLTVQADMRTQADTAARAQASTVQAQIHAVLHPWRSQPVEQATARLHAIDLAALWPQAPTTLLHGTLQAGPASGTGDTPAWALAADLRNDRPGPWDQQRLPLARLQAQAQWDGAHWRIPEARATVGAAPHSGDLLLQGQYTPATGALQGEAQLLQLPPQAVYQTLAAPPLHGRIQARTTNLTADRALVQFEADIRAKPGPADAMAIRSLLARGQWQRAAQGLGQIDLAQLQIDAFQMQAEASSLRIQQGADTDTLAVQGQVQIQAPGSTAQWQGHMAARSGQGSLAWKLTDARMAQRWLSRLPQADQWLPEALRTATLQGQAQLEAQWSGGWHGLRMQAPSAQSSPPLSLQARLTLPQMQWQPAPEAGHATAEAVELRGVAVRLSGNAQQMQVTLEGNASAGNHRLAWNAAADGTWRTPTQWQLRMQSLRAQYHPPRGEGPWAAALAAPLTLQMNTPVHGDNTPSAWELTASAGQLQLSGPAPGTPTLRWDPVRFHQAAGKPPQWQSKGQLHGLPLAWVDALPTSGNANTSTTAPLQRMGLATDMVLEGSWSITATDTVQAHAQLRRASGDLRLQDRGSAVTRTPATVAGAREAAINLALEHNELQARLVWQSERAGEIDAQARTHWQRGQPWPADAPLAGSVRARLPDMGVWSALAPPGWRVRGTLDAQALLSGTRNAPRWTGTLAADDLALRSVVDGVDLQSGRLRATLAGNEMRITEFRLQGSPGSRARIAGQSGNRTPAPTHGGELTATGRLAWADAPINGAAPALSMDLHAQAKALQVLVRADRQVSISGPLQATLQGSVLALRGQLTVDRATIMLPDESVPSLGSDVVVTSAATRRAAAQAAAEPRGTPAQPPDIAITLDLGNDFALQGHGITTRLTGSLELRSTTTAGAPPSVTGDIRTDQGRYRAWGQSLNVESGLIRFGGPYNNPALDILALRPNIAVQAGVHVTGSALAPRVQLYSNPELPDAEKLSWVVLGRDAAAGGAEAAMLQQAALALLGNRGQGTTARLAQSLGVDEIGIRSAAAGEDASATALTLGKRLSQDLYVNYERSLSGTLGTLYIFYDLSRHLTLRGQTGATSAVDVIYTMRYD